MKYISTMLSLLLISIMTISCNNEEGEEMMDVPVPTGNSVTYTLFESQVEGINGTAEFIENEDNSITVNLNLSGTPEGGMHPAHIHVNTAAEGGDIAITLGTVDGSTGESSITFSTQDDGSSISYQQLLDFDGYINVHLSAEELSTIVAQGDIGQNVLTANSKRYELSELAVEGISGGVTFTERENGEALAEISLAGTPEGGSHPAHIHFNTAAEGGGIAFSFNPVDGTSGMSKTNVSNLDDGTAFQYADILEFDGYVNVHLSADELGTIVAQGDIGQNELTENEKEYILDERAVPGIDGTVTFTERINGEALAVISLSGTPEDGSHPAHIHFNSAAEGGGIAFSFNAVDGTSGMSKTNVAALDDETEFGYEDVLAFDGYVNVHLSADQLGTIVAQGDIGQNELTGNEKEYTLDERAVPGISGTVTFSERINGEALAVISLSGTPEGGSHPAHIHVNTAAEGGGIAFSFKPVDGTSGMSATHVAALDDETEFGYADVLDFDGYVNVHLSADELGTIVAQGDIGQNELMNNSTTYTLQEKDVTGISGTVTFTQRMNGEALAVIELTGTPDGGSHPAHIHVNSASQGGGIAFTFKPVDGTSGVSSTNVSMLDDNTMFGYEDVLTYNGYVNVHLSSDDLGTIVAQGDIGSNAN